MRARLRDMRLVATRSRRSDVAVVREWTFAAVGEVAMVSFVCYRGWEEGIR